MAAVRQSGWTRLACWLDDLRYDARHALRSASQSRAFSSVAILTLAIGIGLTTTIFSVVDSVLVRLLPFPDSDRLVILLEPEISRTAPRVNHTEYLEWRSRTRMLDGLAAHTFNPQVMVPTREGTARLSAGMISVNYFEVLGARPALGRLIGGHDEGHPDVVVLSHGTWRTYFRAELNAVATVMEVRGSLGGPSNLAPLTRPDGC
jgi:putative ABC transport system permease protein